MNERDILGSNQVGLRFVALLLIGMAVGTALLLLFLRN